MSDGYSCANCKFDSAFAILKKMKVSEMNRRAVAVVKAYFGKPCLSWESMNNFENVSPFIMTHLKQVYFSMFLVLLSSVLGSVWHFFSNIGGSITLVGFIGCLMWFSSIQPWRERRRVSLLMAAAFCKGASVEFLVRPFITVNQGIIITLLGGTAVAFGCFAEVASRYERERDYTYSYGVLSALILVAAWLFAAAQMFGGKDAYTLYFFAPYIGSWYLLFYLVLYSQEMVEQTRRGNYHYSEHCVKLFTDIPTVSFRFISIFVRIYLVLEYARYPSNKPGIDATMMLFFLCAAEETTYTCYLQK